MKTSFLSCFLVIIVYSYVFKRLVKIMILFIYYVLGISRMKRALILN
ncbi:MAG: hypothetical protein ACI8RD_004785 [Bacillariaceae sp.]|jgi:hypothetical protein